MKLAGADADSRAAALEVDLALDPEWVTFSGFICPQADETEPCAGAASGTLPTGHEYNFSTDEADSGIVKVLLVAVQFPVPLLSEAYFSGPFLMGGDGSFLSFEFTLAQSTAGEVVSISDVVASTPDSEPLSYILEDGILITSGSTN